MFDNFFRKHMMAAGIACALFAATLLSPIPSVIAQGFNLPNNTSVLGHLLAGPGPTGQPPVGTTCTILAGSTDFAGGCTTTSTTAAVTFAQPFTNAPICLVVDQTALPVAAYSTSTTAITLSAVTNAHVLRWICVGR